MTRNCFLSVVIPAYNEDEVIEKTLGDVFAYLSSRPFEAEVLVVNDGSSDETAERVKAFNTAEKRLDLMSLSTNHGKGYAVKEGMRKAGGEVRLFMDADNATEIEEFDRMLPLFQNDANVVIGSRRIPGSTIARHQARWREVGGKIFNALVRYLLGLECRDTQVGFKAFSARAADEIFERQMLSGWAFDVELMVIAHHLGYSVKTVPVRWADRGRSRLSLTGMVSACLDVLTIDWNRRRGEYQ